MATITDVARLAGVSIGTVSHVVNGSKTVSDQTRARVLAAIDQTGYRPHHAARSLRRSRTDSVGLVLSDAGHVVFADMVRGIEAEASAAGYVILVTNSAGDPDREARSISALRDRRVDGMLIARVAGSHPGLLENLRGEGIPLVLLDRLGRPDLDQVGVENREAMRSLVAHLLERGHRRIGYVGADPTLPTLAERFDGYRQALAVAGVDLDHSLIVGGLPTTEATSTLLVTSEAVEELLRREHAPTALVGASVIHSMGALRAIEAVARRIPDDIAFVTFDEPAYADILHPRLTAVVQPAFEIGRRAMRLLRDRMDDQDEPPTTIRVAPTVSHRWSCGCRPDEPFVAAMIGTVTGGAGPPGQVAGR